MYLIPDFASLHPGYKLGLTRYSEADLLELLSENAFSATRLEPNFGYDHVRLAVVATRLG